MALPFSAFFGAARGGYFLRQRRSFFSLPHFERERNRCCFELVLMATATAAASALVLGRVGVVPSRCDFAARLPIAGGARFFAVSCKMRERNLRSTSSIVSLLDLLCFVFPITRSNEYANIMLDCRCLGLSIHMVSW